MLIDFDSLIVYEFITNAIFSIVCAERKSNL